MKARNVFLTLAAVVLFVAGCGSEPKTPEEVAEAVLTAVFPVAATLVDALERRADRKRERYISASPDGAPSDGAIPLDRRELLALHPAVGTRVIALALRNLGMEKDLSQATLWAAWEMLQRGRGSGEAEFAGGFRLTLDHDLAIVRRIEQPLKM